MDQDQIRAALTGRAGTPQELAALVGQDPQNSTFKRALQGLVDDGLLEAAGTTRDRRYQPTVAPAPSSSPSSAPQRLADGSWPPVASKHTGEPLPLDPATGVPLTAEQIRQRATTDDWARASVGAVKASATGTIGSGQPRSEKKRR